MRNEVVEFFSQSTRTMLSMGHKLLIKVRLYPPITALIYRVSVYSCLLTWKNQSTDPAFAKFFDENFDFQSGLVKAEAYTLDMATVDTGDEAEEDEEGDS